MTGADADPFVPRRFTSADRMMWITPDRVFYAGLLGDQRVHASGAIVAYVAIDGELRVRIDEKDWVSADVAVVQPNIPCEIACEGRHVVNVSVEPETVDAERLPSLLRGCGAVHAPEFAARVRDVHRRLVAPGGVDDLQPSDFDPLFFGGPLPPKALDRRITTVLETISRNPGGSGAAADCASLVNLSFSRFLHLFKEEVGIPFRNVRSWKRARSLLHHVQTSSNLLHLALDIGYPDSTHFSHSIRQVYGLKPKDIIAGSRKLRIIAHETEH